MTSVQASDRKIEGVVAPETAAHAAGTSALLLHADPWCAGFTHCGRFTWWALDLGAATRDRCCLPSRKTLCGD